MPLYALHMHTLLFIIIIQNGDWKGRTATSHAKVVTYKNKPDGRMCHPVRKLWPVRTHFSGGEVVN